MNTCPKCGSPHASELTLSGFSLRKAMWFGCGSHVLLDEPEKLLSRTNQCCDQEEINDLRRKRDQLMGENSQQAERIRELEEQRRSDEGNLYVETIPYELSDDYFQSEIEDWAWSVYDYSGAGDGTDYGDDIVYDLKNGKVSTSEWFHVVKEEKGGTSKLKIEEDEE